MNSNEEIEAEVERRLSYYRKLREQLERASVYMEVVDQLAQRAGGYQRGLTHEATSELFEKASAYLSHGGWMPTLELERRVGEFGKQVHAIRAAIEKVRGAQVVEGKTRSRLTNKLDLIEQTLNKADACFADNAPITEQQD